MLTNRAKRLSAARCKGTLVPRLEELEPRLAPAWQPLGAAPQDGGSPKFSEANSATWSEPVTGRINAIAFAQDNLSRTVALVGADGGGVWRSLVDANFLAGTPTWSPRTDSVALQDAQTGLGAGAINVTCITVDPNNSRVIYVGTGGSHYGSGILKSVDGGDTFSIVSSGPVMNGLPAFFRHQVWQIVVDPQKHEPGHGKVDDSIRSAFGQVHPNASRTRHL